MSGKLREAMLAHMAELRSSIDSLNTSIDEAVSSANQLCDQPVAGAVWDAARWKRVQLLEIQSQLMSLDVAFTKRFGAGP